MKEIQFVVSVVRAEEPRKWDVKIGLFVVGQVDEVEGSWRWRRGEVSSLPLRDRMTAVFDLLQHHQDDQSGNAVALEDDRDVLNFESQGLEVVLYGSAFRCTACGEVLPGSEVGLRRINDHLIRSQPQCKRCRSRR